MCQKLSLTIERGDGAHSAVGLSHGSPCFQVENHKHRNEECTGQEMFVATQSVLNGYMCICVYCLCLYVGRCITACVSQLHSWLKKKLICLSIYSASLCSTMQRQPLDKEASLWHSNEGGKRRGAAVHGKDEGVGSGVVRLG